MNQSQQLMLAMQTETMRLRQENQKLLLDHQPPLQTTEPPKDFEEIEEGIQQVDPVIAEKVKSNGWTWPVLTMGILAVGCWIVLQISPESQLKIAELVRW